MWIKLHLLSIWCSFLIFKPHYSIMQLPKKSSEEIYADKSCFLKNLKWRKGTSCKRRENGQIDSLTFSTENFNFTTLLAWWHFLSHPVEKIFFFLCTYLNDLFVSTLKFHFDQLIGTFWKTGNQKRNSSERRFLWFVSYWFKEYFIASV